MMDMIILNKMRTESSFDKTILYAQAVKMFNQITVLETSSNLLLDLNVAHLLCFSNHLGHHSVSIWEVWRLKCCDLSERLYPL